MENTVTPILTSRECSIYNVGAYRALKGCDVARYVVSTPETRAICNDPFVTGLNYTSALRTACAKTLAGLNEKNLVILGEDDTTVLHVLRGGLNFELRAALGEAFGWNNHASAFISAQRARKQPNSEDWIITESDYRKIHLKKRNNVVFGDVVATGTSLEFALKRLSDAAKDAGCEIESLVFFTIGGPRSHEILATVDSALRATHPEYRGASVVYFEGIFSVASPRTKMQIAIDGTDLIRTESILAPEFIESQYENPSFPIERCTIYDAGSRAFDPDEYFHDIRGYWSQTLALAEKGTSYSDLLKERFPELNSSRFPKVDLKALCHAQLKKIPAGENALPSKGGH